MARQGPAYPADLAPPWVWMYAATFAAAGVYRWSLLVAQTTGPGTTVRWVGPVVFGLIAAAAPVDPTITEVPAIEPGSAVVSRRLAVNRLFGVGIFVIGGTLTASIAGAVRQPRIRRPTIAIRSLPDEAVGTRIALISDLHVGSLTTRVDGRRIADLANARSPDIVCLAGDFIDGDASELGADLAPLADIGVRVPANESVQVRAGHYTVGGTQVSVTNGGRFWVPVARLGAPTDITVLDLARARPEACAIRASTSSR